MWRAHELAADGVEAEGHHHGGTSYLDVLVYTCMQVSPTMVAESSSIFTG